MAPQSLLEWDRVQELLPTPVSRERLEELLFDSKVELLSLEGNSLQISVTPDRLDLLSEGGLALALAGALGVAQGLPPIASTGPSSEVGSFHIEVEASVMPLRPEIAGLVARPPAGRSLDERTLAEAIRVQELLHASVGRDRRRASLGIYALERMRSPLRYALDPIAEVRFTPLDRAGEVDAEEFFAEHPMAARYGSLGRDGDRCLVLADHAGRVASLPPILNARGSGEVRPGDGPLLLESTGTHPRAVRESLALLSVVFAARGYAIDPVPIARAGPGTAGGSASWWGPRSVRSSGGQIAGIFGREVDATEIGALAARARLDVAHDAHGFHFRAAPWRPDLLGPVDVAEDLLFAAGVRVEDSRQPPSFTRGRRRPESRFRRRFAPVLLGLGFQPVHTPVLVSEEAIERAGRRAEAVPLANPPSREYSFLRPALVVSLLETLRRNRRSGYPQRFSEGGPIVVPAPGAESGASTRYRAGILLAHESAGFAEAAAIVDLLLRSIDVSSIREPAELPGTIPGRAARIRVTSESVAEIGEVHPSVLEAIGVPVPAAYAEVDLTGLWPLIDGRGTV